MGVSKLQSSGHARKHVPLTTHVPLMGFCDLWGQIPVQRVRKPRELVDMKMRRGGRKSA